MFRLNIDDIVILAAGEEEPYEGVENVESATKATKHIINNQLIIEKNSKKFNVLGTEVR